MQATDWFRVFWDLIQRGHAIRHISHRSGIPEPTIRGYMQGSHPPHWRGEIIVAMWCQATGKQREDLPTADLVIMPRVVKRRELDTQGAKCLEAALK